MFSKSLQNAVAKAPALWRNTFIVAVAFSTYFCAYGFRKPFTAGTYDHVVVLPGLGEIDYKILLIIAQVFGYMLAKFMGIKIISEVKKDAAVLFWWIVLLISASAISWIFLPLVAVPYNAIFIFINGFPLGLIWGLVFSFLEGRKHTEVLGTGLSASFIFAAAFSQDIGQQVLNWGASEYWMPFYVSMMYMLPLIISVWLLGHTPPPNAEDEALRTKRTPMNGAERRAFFQEFGFGVAALTLVYSLFNAYRETRSNFAKEIWTSIGYTGSLEQFKQSELIISVLILVVLGAFYRITNNRTALRITLIVVALGAIFVGGGTFLFQQGMISGWAWMFLIGLGTYMGYIPIGAFVFDRLLAAARWVGTVGFLIYLIDAVAYIGSISILIIKNFFFVDFNWLKFMQTFAYWLMIINVIFLMIAIVYFDKRIQAVLKKNSD